MKKLLILACLTVISTPAVNAQVCYGGNLGINMFNGTYKYMNTNGSSEKEKGTFKPGFQIGGFINEPLCPRSNIETGLYFSTRGYNFKDDDRTSKVTIDYLELPVIADYRFCKRRCGEPFIYGGPYIGIDIGGKEKETYTTGGHSTTTTEKLKFGNDPHVDEFRSFNYGVKLGAGFQLNDPFSFKLDYSQGLANMRPGGNSNNKYHNWGFTLSASYNLNYKNNYTAPPKESK